VPNETITAEDRAGAILAHLSGYAGYVVPCGGVIVPLIIVFAAQTRTTALVARQALMLNVLGFVSVLPAIGVLTGAMLVENNVLRAVVMTIAGLWCAVVVALALLCPLIGAIRAAGGSYFQYPIFGLPPLPPTTDPAP
jgi:uncharacterized Tic20 family protein